MRNWIKEWGAVFVIAMLLVAIGTMAFAVDVKYEVSMGDDSRAYHLGWNLNGVGVTNALYNPNLYTEHVLCGFTNSGDGVYSLNLQTSQTETGTFINATTVHTFNVNDTDTSLLSVNTIGGPYWLWNSSDVDLTAANIVTFSCDFWR